MKIFGYVWRRCGSSHQDHYFYFYLNKPLSKETIEAMVESIEEKCPPLEPSHTIETMVAYTLDQVSTDRLQIVTHYLPERVLWIMDLSRVVRLQRGKDMAS